MSDPFTVWFGDSTGSHLGFATHMPILASAMLQARPGPVVEFGVGFFSTPLIHLTCSEMGREGLSLEHDAAWLEKFADMRRSWHRLVSVATWADAEPIVDALPSIAVAFLDHTPNTRRIRDAHRLAPRTEFVVVHDWSGGAVEQEIAAAFTYRWVSRAGPQTAVLSNTRAFSL